MPRNETVVGRSGARAVDKLPGLSRMGRMMQYAVVESESNSMR